MEKLKLTEVLEAVILAEYLINESVVSNRLLTLSRLRENNNQKVVSKIKTCLVDAYNGNYYNIELEAWINKIDPISIDWTAIKLFHDAKYLNCMKGHDFFLEVPKRAEYHGITMIAKRGKRTSEDRKKDKK